MSVSKSSAVAKVMVTITKSRQGGGGGANTMGRMGLSPKMLAIIKAIYKRPEFTVEVDGTSSQWYRQGTGIRQGCPLSPCLFILVMHVMFTECHNRQGTKIRKGLIDGLDFTEILYADDTLLATKSTTAMNTLLKNRK